MEYNFGNEPVVYHGLRKLNILKLEKVGLTINVTLAPLTSPLQPIVRTYD